MIHGQWYKVIIKHADGSMDNMDLVSYGDIHACVTEIFENNLLEPGDRLIIRLASEDEEADEAINIYKRLGLKKDHLTKVLEMMDIEKECKDKPVGKKA